jgi:Protein of unknown function (DUF1376)
LAGAPGEGDVTDLPAPLVPAEVDLRDYAYMPLDVVRLMRSSTWRKVRRRPELGYWMMNLWASSWHEVPAASLPDDDDELSDFARCEPKLWDKVRTKVLAGWVKCSDGRIYHPVVAEKALEGWGKMTLQRKQTHAARQAKKLKLLLEKTKPAAEPAASSVTETETASNQMERRGEEQNREEIPSPAEAASPATAREAAAAAAEPVDDLKIPDFPKRNAETDAAFALWSPVAYALGIPDIGYLNADRREALTKRLAEIGGIDGWKLFLEKVREAEFLRETDGRPKFWVGLSKLLEPETFCRLMEGRYAEHHETHRRSADAGAPTVLDGVAAAFARRSVSPGG